MTLFLAPEGGSTGEKVPTQPRLLNREHLQEHHTKVVQSGKNLLLIIDMLTMKVASAASPWERHEYEVLFFFCCKLAMRSPFPDILALILAWFMERSG